METSERQFCCIMLYNSVYYCTIVLYITEYEHIVELVWKSETH